MALREGTCDETPFLVLCYENDQKIVSFGFKMARNGWFLPTAEKFPGRKVRVWTLAEGGAVRQFGIDSVGVDAGGLRLKTVAGVRQSQERRGG